MAVVWQQWVNGFDGTTAETDCVVTVKSGDPAPLKNRLISQIANATDTSDTAIAYITNVGLTNDQGRVRFKFRTGGRHPGTDNHTILILNNGAAVPVIDLFINSSGQLAMFSAANTLRSTSLSVPGTTVLQANTEYDIELAWYGSTGGDGWRRLWLNNALEIQNTGYTMVSANDCNAALVHWGIDHYDGADTLGLGHTYRFAQIANTAFTQLKDPATDYRIEVLADVPAAYWRLHDVSGNVQDSSENANHATSNSGTITYRQAGPLNGQDSYSILFGGGWFIGPDHLSLDVGDSFSIEVWLKLTTVNDALRVMFSKRSGGPSLGIEAQDGVMLGKADVNFVYVSDDNFEDTTNWWHVVWTKSGTSRQFYRNGEQRASTVANEVTIDNTTGNFEIGAEAGTQAFPGYLAELALYDFVLSPAQVAAHYNARNGVLTTAYALPQMRLF